VYTSVKLYVVSLQTGEKFDIIFKYTPDNREIREKLSITIARKKRPLEVEKQHLNIKFVIR